MRYLLATLLLVSTTAMAAGTVNDVGIAASGSPVVAPAAVSQTATMANTTQQGRIFRDAVASTCAGKAYPGIFNAGTTYNYSAFTLFNNGPTQCVTVNFDPNPAVNACTTNAHASAYLNSYDPANQAANFLGDVGSSVTQPFSFPVPAGGRVILVVSNTSSQANCAFSFSSAQLDNQAIVPGVPTLDTWMLVLLSLALVTGLVGFGRSRFQR